MKYLSYICFVFLLVCFAGCTSETEIDDFTTDLRLEYSPLEPGIERQYRVDSILFKLGVSGLERDTQSYIFYESVVDSFESVTGVNNFITDQRKVNLNTQVEAFHQYTSRIDNNVLVVSSDNRPIMPLVFPPRVNRNWDGLSLFDAASYIKEVQNEPIVLFKDWTNFRIVEVGATYEVNDQIYEDVITVLQTDTENAIERRYALERWAPDIGMIYREHIILDTQNITDDPWEVKAERGYILYQSLISQ